MKMAPVSSEGSAPFDIPSASRPCHTWYKILGQFPSDSIPLIALHGGPGAGHEYLAPLEDLVTHHQIPVVLYDQIGCGRSTALPEKNGDESFWTVELFERELDNLVKHLGINQFDLFGRSWGGMFGSVYAAKRPPGLRKLILMGAPASQDLSLAGTARLRTQLPRNMQDVLAKGGSDTPAYKEACLEFYKRFLCRCDPWPTQLVESMAHLEQDPTVYGTMHGASEIVCTGSMKGWSAIPEVHKIQSSTLIINGEFDEVAEEASLPFFEEIPKVKWIILPNVSHMAMWEDRERFIRVVSVFLRGSQ